VTLPASSSRLGTYWCVITLTLAAGGSASAQPAGTAFTYQGRLTDNGTPATGAFDFQCVLYTAAVGGTQVGPTVTPNDVAVANGLFTVTLDFGATAFAGSVRFLEIGVRPGASTGAYTILGARQEIKPAPHTVFAQAAPWSGLSGMPAGFADGVDNDSGGDITSVGVGTGLTGGGTAGALTIGIDYPTLTLNHNHFGQTWNGSQTSGLDVNNSAANGAGLRVASTATTGAGVGVLSLTSAAGGIGLDGGNSAATGLAIGVRGTTGSNTGRAVYGLSLSTGAGSSAGVAGEASGPGSSGVLGLATSTGSITFGVQGVSAAAFGRGVYGNASSTIGNPYGVLGHAAGSGGYGVLGQVTATTGNTAGVIGLTLSTQGTGVWGETNATNGVGIGVLGIANSSVASAVYGLQNAGTGFAGWFNRNVHVNGTLSKAAGSFKIDHPLDPENKYLYHSFVESPDMKNVYDGIAVTDADGFATVELPEWLEALNRDFRYQLTVLDQGDTLGFVQVKVAQKIADNRFRIRASAPRVEVSWQVTGIRKDPYAEKHRIPVEEDKAGDERGRYMHPDEWARPADRGVDWPRVQRLVGRERPSIQEN
jgi:hypothetical protein